MVQFQIAAKFRTAKTKWTGASGKASGGGQCGSWALKNGFIFGEIETSGKGGSAGGAKVQQYIQQWPGFGYKTHLFGE